MVVNTEAGQSVIIYKWDINFPLPFLEAQEAFWIDCKSQKSGKMQKYFLFMIGYGIFELTEALVAYRRPVQDQGDSCSSMDGVSWSPP